MKVKKMDCENKEEIVLKAYMHCEGCSVQVSNCLKGFEGVEEVKTDMKGNRVIVKGLKADPCKVLERVKKKYSRNAELISPKPKPKLDDEKKEIPAKKQEPPVKVIVLKMYMHCQGCANDIKKSVEKMRGILSVEPDMKESTVTIRGNFDPPKLVQTITKRLGKYAEIVAMVPSDNGNGNEKKKEKKKEKGKKKDKEEEIIFYYPPQYSVEHIYPNQIFSDENIFSCSIM